MIVSNTYILSPSGKRLSFNGKGIMEKKFVWQVKVVNTSQWVSVPVTSYTVFPGTDVNIQVNYLNNADYTYINASNATVTSTGIQVTNVQSDLLVTISDAKVVLTVTSNDTEAIQSITPATQHVPINTTATCSVVYNSGFAYDQVEPSRGTMTVSGMEIPVGDTNIGVTVSPKMLKVNIVNNDVRWASTQSSHYELRYDTQLNVPVTYTDDATSNCLASPVSTDVDGKSGVGVTVTSDAFTVPDGIVHGGTITMTPAKVQVKPSVQTAYINSITPTVSYVTPGTSASFTVEYAQGHDSSDILIDKGTLSGNTYTVPTSSGSWYSSPSLMESFSINGRTYPTVTMGNLIWMAENLDYAWPGLSITSNAGSGQRANYFKGDQYTYGYNGQKFGLLYNGYALNYLYENSSTMLPTGWRIPSIDDFVNLLTYIGCTPTSTTSAFTGYTGPSYKLYATDSIWQNWSMCSDDYGMHMVPAARWKLGTNKFDYGSTGFWCTDMKQYDERALCRFDSYKTAGTPYAYIVGSTFTFGYCIRLVRDA